VVVVVVVVVVVAVVGVGETAAITSSVVKIPEEHG